MSESYLDLLPKAPAETKSFRDYPQSRGKTDTHKGTDYLLPINTPIAADIGGIVRHNTKDSKGYGNAVEIVDEKGNVLQRYAHLNKFSIPDGTKIEPGQILGLSGNTGRSSGPHLHFEDFRPENQRQPAPQVVAQAQEQTTEEAPNYLSLVNNINLDKINEPVETEYRPGYFNPNLVAQGERARAAGGGNLAPIVEGITGALKSMNLEDWQKESLLANMLKYGLGTMPIVGDEAFAKEGEQKILQTGKAGLEAIMNPVQTMQAIAEQEPGQLLGNVMKGAIYDAPLGFSARPVYNAAATVAKPVLNVAGKVAEPVVESVANKFGTLQEAMQAVRNPSVTIQGANYRPDLDTQMAGVGAALTTNAEAVKNALYQAKPELVADLIRQTGVRSFDELPFDKLPLEVIERHNKFAKFDMTPTEGEALQDIKKMSIETNERTKDDLIRQRLEERDPKLIAGFNKIRETVAPDVYEKNPAILANTALEKLKQNFELRSANEAALYKKLEDANGGDFPMDVGELDKNIITSLKAKKSYRDVENNTMYLELKDQLATGKMTFDDFEHFRTRLATAIRSSKNGNERFGLGIIKDQLENMPIPENLSHLKPLADEARNAFRAHKELQEKLPAYKAAIDDTRTSAEILRGDLHPASNQFIDKFYGAKTKQVELSRLLDELGIDSPEHQGLNAAIIDKIKGASGVKVGPEGETGKISQASLSDQINKIYGNNLPTMFKKEHLKDLQDLSDVANMTEHVKGQHSVATSNTPLEMERLRKKEMAENMALDLGENVVNMGTKGFGGTIVRKLYEIKKGKSLQEAAELEEKIKSQKRVSPSAGIQLKDIGKE